MELGEVGAHAVLEHEAVVAPVVGFAHRGVDADFRRHAGDDELLDAAVLQDRVKVGGVEGALARLVDDRLAGLRVELGDDVVARLAAHQDAAHRARRRRCWSRCVRELSWLAADRRDRAGGPRACGSTSSPAARHAARRRLLGSIVRRNCETSLPSISPKPPGSRKSRCMSMMSNAQWSGASSKA